MRLENDDSALDLFWIQFQMKGLYLDFKGKLNALLYKRDETFKISAKDKWVNLSSKWKYLKQKQFLVLKPLFVYINLFCFCLCSRNLGANIAIFFWQPQYNFYRTNPLPMDNFLETGWSASSSCYNQLFFTPKSSFHFIPCDKISKIANWKSTSVSWGGRAGSHQTLFSASSQIRLS